MESTSSPSTTHRDGSPECGRPDLAQRLASGEELSGSFGSEIAAHAKVCADCSIRLSLVQQAERWLADHASSNRAAVSSPTPCPSAEDLFDFGRGPGARALNQGLERRIQAHLVDCEDCRGLVATLATRPPAPLLDAARANGLATADGVRPPAARPRPSIAPVEKRPAAKRRVLSYAAAAAVLLGALYLWNVNRTSHGAGRSDLADAGIVFPEGELLRGDLADALRFPRGNVLGSPTPDVQGTWHVLHFELTPQSAAAKYRIVLSRLPSNVLADSELILRHESETAEFDLGEALVGKLHPGKYSWEAWASVNGLDRSLGQRDFEIIDDTSARELLAKSQKLEEPVRSSTILKWLVDHDYNTDARAYSRGLPQSPERDKFISRLPGR
jgi:hypothetical protein